MGDFGVWPVILHGQPNQTWYSCEGKTQEQWFARGIRREAQGVYLYITGGFFMLVYSLSLIGMLKAKLIYKSPCYVIMLFMGIGDLSMIVMSSFITGFLCWEGAVYCNYPMLIYIVGNSGLGFWSSSCVCCITLAINRLAEIAGWRGITSFLNRRNCFIICLLGMAYGTCITLFTPAALYNSALGAWFFDPATDNHKTYENVPHRIQNLVVSIFAIFVYSYMCWKASRKWGWSAGMSKAQRLLYIQAFVICTTHVMAAWGYMLMNTIPGFPAFMIMWGHHAWQWSHGVPGVVYLTLNRTIKIHVLGLFGLQLKTRTYTLQTTDVDKSEHSQPRY